LNEFNGELALNIFEEFYGEEYIKVWVGIVSDRTFFSYEPNEYFGTRPAEVRGGDLNKRSVPHVIERISLNENKTVEVVLKVKK